MIGKGAGKPSFAAVSSFSKSTFSASSLKERRRIPNDSGESGRLLARRGLRLFVVCRFDTLSPPGGGKDVKVEFYTKIKM